MSSGTFVSFNTWIIVWPATKFLGYRPLSPGVSSDCSLCSCSTRHLELINPLRPQRILSSFGGSIASLACDSVLIAHMIFLGPSHMLLVCRFKLPFLKSFLKLYLKFVFLSCFSFSVLCFRDTIYVFVAYLISVLSMHYFSLYFLTHVSLFPLCLLSSSVLSSMSFLCCQKCTFLSRWSSFLWWFYFFIHFYFSSYFFSYFWQSMYFLNSYSSALRFYIKEVIISLTF